MRELTLTPHQRPTTPACTLVFPRGLVKHKELLIVAATSAGTSQLPSELEADAELHGERRNRAIGAWEVVRVVAAAILATERRVFEPQESRVRRSYSAIGVDAESVPAVVAADAVVAAGEDNVLKVKDVEEVGGEIQKRPFARQTELLGDAQVHATGGAVAEGVAPKGHARCLKRPVA